MSDNLESNPFLGLFGSAQEVKTFQHKNEDSEGSASSDQDDEAPSVAEKHKFAVNSLIEEVFCITICRRHTSTPLVFMDETATGLEPEDKLDVHNLEQALFERLLLDEPANHVIRPTALRSPAINHHVVETEVLTYLFECHKRLMDLKRFQTTDLVQVIEDMDNLVIRNVATALSQPDLYGTQRLHVQFLGMLNDYENDHLTSLLNPLVHTILSEEGNEQGLRLLTAALNPVLDEIKECAKNSSLSTLNRNHLYLMEFFSTNPTLGHILVAHSTPSGKEGSAYSDTLFGAILSTSCLPRNGILHLAAEQIQYDHTLESSYHTGLKFICDCMHSVFFNLFKTSVLSRHALLTWIGKCLQANAPRGQLSNSNADEIAAIASLTNVSDGFMLNLEGVLLRMCKPFIAKDIAKILKVDPSYCAAEVTNDAEANERWVHLRGMTSETCLIPWDAEEMQMQRPSALSFNFVTEIFFMTHRALHLGAQVVFGRLMQLNQNLAMLQQHMETNQGSASDFSQRLRQTFDQEMTRTLVIQASLLEPSSLSLMGDFYAATAEWLVQVAIHPTVPEQQETFAPQNFISLSFPLPEHTPSTLSCIPEFLIENVACYQSMVHRLVSHELEGKGVQFLEPLLSQVLVFMGSRQYMRNPHLRARLAECLESLVPPDQVTTARRAPSSLNRENLFKNHPHRSQIVPCLLDVFVSIEVTGESVTFEQKFNYRRPMYVVMDYLWTIAEQRKVFKSLAVEAEADMTAVSPPLFLRFIYLLMNDAVFLLDEALSNMAQLKTLQNARDNGEWDNLPQRERQQNENNLLHIGRMARIDNILGKETIHTLEYVTREITSIFCDPILVDRIASMLNYFLVHLVGPKMKNFKVKDQEAFKFKPADLVMDICRIYVNLGKSDAFCLAVSQDGRSYNSKLFQQAEQVLVRIGGGMLITDLLLVAARAAELAQQQNEEDEALAEAPEEFYDPILSTLMSDPVILPSSKTTCDRSTLAKHLLSDQTDPFTKAPLTMAQVIPNVELKNRIEAWRNERCSQRVSASTSQENASPNKDN